MASLFGGGKAAPSLTPPPTMPDPMSPDALDAKRRAMANAGKEGRSSTALTTAQASDTLAGTYASGKLGAKS